MKHIITLNTNNLSTVHSAIQFIETNIADIELIFCYKDGCYTANKYIDTAVDEPNVIGRLQAIIAENKLNAVVCGSSAARRGVVADILAPGFKMGSLSELALAINDFNPENHVFTEFSHGENLIINVVGTSCQINIITPANTLESLESVEVCLGLGAFEVNVSVEFSGAGLEILGDNVKINTECLKDYTKVISGFDLYGVKVLNGKSG